MKPDGFVLRNLQCLGELLEGETFLAEIVTSLLEVLASLFPGRYCISQDCDLHLRLARGIEGCNLPQQREKSVMKMLRPARWRSFLEVTAAAAALEAGARQFSECSTANGANVERLKTRRGGGRTERVVPCSAQGGHFAEESQV